MSAPIESGSDAAIEAVPVRDSAAHELAVELNAEVQAGGHTDRAKALIQMLVEASAEAVAEERQRIEAVLNGCDLFAADAPYNAAAWQLRGDLLAAAGSVPVATPEPAKPICEQGRTDAHAVDYPLYCPGPVATPAEPEDCHVHGIQLSGRCVCGAIQAVAEPSVGTGTPAEERRRILDAIRVEMLAINSRYVGTTEAATGYLDGLSTALAIVGEGNVPAEEVSGGSGHVERRHERDMRMADLQVASRDEQIDRLTAEVARYRAAIEHVTRTLAICETHGMTTADVVTNLRHALAALGDGA